MRETPQRGRPCIDQAQVEKLKADGLGATEIASGRGQHSSRPRAPMNVSFGSFIVRQKPPRIIAASGSKIFRFEIDRRFFTKMIEVSC
jgi:hypothetical protein